MLIGFVLIGLLVIPVPWEITFMVALGHLNGGSYRGLPQWVRAGPHFAQPLCALRGRCRHGTYRPRRA
jgi:hypothetical protein